MNALLRTWGGGQEETWIGTGTFGGARGNAAMWDDTSLLLYMDLQVYPKPIAMPKFPFTATTHP